MDRKDIRRMAYRDTFKLMPKIVTEGLAVFPKGVATIFARPFKKRNKKQSDIDE